MEENFNFTKKTRDK